MDPKLYDRLKNADFTKPIVFISYATPEIELADFVKKLIMAWTDNKIDVFIAKRDIASGRDWQEVMMKDKLKLARALIPICSVMAKETPWVWWDSAPVWAKEQKLYPLFTNISANDFGAPLNLVAQGKEFFNHSEFIETLKTVCKDLGVDISTRNFNEKDLNDYQKLRNKYFHHEPYVSKLLTRVDVGFDTKLRREDLHEYSFRFDIENISNKALDNLIIELYFPQEYLETKNWTYNHLASTDTSREGYILLVFTYSGLTDAAKAKYGLGILPRKTLRVFGEGGVTRLIYAMDHTRWDKRLQYKVEWNVYVNGQLSEKGSIPFEKLQEF